MSNWWQRQTRIDFWVTLGFCVTIIALLVLMWVAAFMVAVTPAKAHSWYSWACCHDRDCHPVASDAVRETDRGYEVIGQVIPYNDPRIQVSQDAQFHICQPHPPEIRCLYVPARSF